MQPFRVEIPQAQLDDLARRLAETRWPVGLPEAGWDRGVPVDYLKELAEYWRTEFDWRKVEERLNAFPQFTPTIDGANVHFLHVRSPEPDATPMIITHGWPGSVIEQLKIIDPLTNPTAHGGNAADAFDVVIPSLPGYGFSGKPTATGWDPIRVARAWVVLMQRLGYTKYVAQGGDWGNAVTEQMALLTPPGLAGIHTNMPATVPDEITKLLPAGPPPAGLSADEKYAWDQLSYFYAHGLGYAQEMANRPQTLYALTDSPVGLAATTARAHLATNCFSECASTFTPSSDATRARSSVGTW